MATRGPPSNHTTNFLNRIGLDNYYDGTGRCFMGKYISTVNTGRSCLYLIARVVAAPLRAADGILKLSQGADSTNTFDKVATPLETFQGGLSFIAFIFALESLITLRPLFSKERELDGTPKQNLDCNDIWQINNPIVMASGICANVAFLAVAVIKPFSWGAYQIPVKANTAIGYGISVLFTVSCVCDLIEDCYKFGKYMKDGESRAAQKLFFYIIRDLAELAAAPVENGFLGTKTNPHVFIAFCIINSAAATTSILTITVIDTVYNDVAGA